MEDVISIPRSLMVDMILCCLHFTSRPMLNTPDDPIRNLKHSNHHIERAAKIRHHSIAMSVVFITKSSHDTVLIYTGEGN